MKQISKETHETEYTDLILNRFKNDPDFSKQKLIIGYRTKAEYCPECGQVMWENRNGNQWCQYTFCGYKSWEIK